MNHFYSSDYNTDKIYKHDGFSASILDSFSSPSTYPRDLTFDGTNLYSGDQDAGKYYKHDGFSSTILESFPFSVRGLAFDGLNFYSSRLTSSKFWKHDGFSATIIASFSSGYGAEGLTWDGNNLLTATSDNDKIFRRDGFSATILSSANAPSAHISGVTWDGVNLYSTDYATPKIWKHDGFSSTILDSFSSPSTHSYGLTNDFIGTYSSPQIVSSEIAFNNSYCKLIFSKAVYSDPIASQTINKDDLSLLFSQNGGVATGASITGLYADSDLTTLLDSGTGYDTVYAKLSITGIPTGIETIEIKPASGSAIYDVSGNAMSDIETTGALSLYNVPASIINGVMANNNAYVEIDFSEAVWSDSGNTAELTSDSFLVDFQQNGGGISGASINALYQDAALSIPLASGAGYSTVYAQLLVTSGFPTGAETIEIKPKDGSSIYDSSGGVMDAAETTGLLYFHSVGSAVSLNWSTFDPVISALRSIISLFLVSLFGHGLHVFFTDKALFQEVENDLHTRISSLPTSNQALGIELLNFFQRYYGK